MPDAFALSTHDVAHVPLAPDTPTRLDASGALATEAAVASLVVTSDAGGVLRCALVVRPGTRVCVGARVVSGVEPLCDRDHVHLPRAEVIVSLDAHPQPVPAPPAAPCPVCRGAEASPQATWLACPRCGARRCAACWARTATCATAGCGQPAARERALWRPVAADFARWTDPGGS